MPNANDNGETPGDNVGANQNDGTQGDGTPGTNPANNANNTDQSKANQVVFADQKAVDAMIQKRIDRALKDEKAKAELSETDRLKKDADDAKRELLLRDVRDDLAAELGVDAKKAKMLFQAFKDDIEFDEKTGRATNLKDVAKQIKTDYPELFAKLAPGSADAGAGRQKGGGGDAAAGGMNNFIRTLAGKK